MQRFCNTRGARRAARGAPWRLLAALLLCPAPASAEVALYQAEAQLHGLSEADRAAGFGEALRVAAVRMSGRRDAASNPVIAAAAADAGRYVQQYSTTAERTLKVGFDGASLEQLLQRAGLPLWPAERPTTLVALFLPAVAGGGRAVLASEHPPERAELERAAQYRGIALDWPQQAIDPVAARARSSRGAAAASLVGVAAGDAFRWTFSHAGETAQAQGSPGAGADLAADTLAARYAPASTRSVTTVSATVDGVADIRAYAALLDYLQSLSLVRDVAVDEVSGQQVRLSLALRGDLELLRRIAALDTHLQPAARPTEPADPAGGTGADFTWQP